MNVQVEGAPAKLWPDGAPPPPPPDAGELPVSEPAAAPVYWTEDRVSKMLAQLGAVMASFTGDEAAKFARWELDIASPVLAGFAEDHAPNLPQVARRPGMEGALVVVAVLAFLFLPRAVLVWRWQQQRAAGEQPEHPPYKPPAAEPPPRPTPGAPPTTGGGEPVRREPWAGAPRPGRENLQVVRPIQPGEWEQVGSGILG